MLGVEKSLGALLPAVAAMDGDDGGSVERVKYTTFANEPPTYFEKEKARQTTQKNTKNCRTHVHRDV